MPLAPCGPVCILRSASQCGRKYRLVAVQSFRSQAGRARVPDCPGSKSARTDAVRHIRRRCSTIAAARTTGAAAEIIVHRSRAGSAGARSSITASLRSRRRGTGIQTTQYRTSTSESRFRGLKLAPWDRRALEPGEGGRIVGPLSVIRRWRRRVINAAERQNISESEISPTPGIRCDGEHNVDRVHRRAGCKAMKQRATQHHREPHTCDLWFTVMRRCQLQNSRYHCRSASDDLD